MRRWVWLTGLALSLAAGHARAAPGLANKVYTPYVENGVTEVEVRGGRLNGGPLDGENGALVELEHGFSDRLSLALVGEFEHEAGENAKLDSIGLESVVYLGQVPGVGVDVGGYLEYEQRLHAESCVLEAKLLLARQAGRVQTLVNLIAERPLSSRADQQVTAFSYAAETTFAATPTLRVGVQAFGDLGTDRSFGGRQAHYVGPVAHVEWRPAWAGRGEIELEAAYLLPVSSAARRQSDGQVRFVVEFERRF